MIQQSFVSDRERGFSLVELSIVLVILGLLTGGVLTGQSLIRAAELRSITAELQQHQTAVHAFKNKYLALPGDMTNATSFWGDNTTHCADAAITDGTPGTCNGNGDGIIMHEAANAGEESEGYMMWQHLANAGIIEGSYSGLTGAGDEQDSVIGENVPESRVSGGCWNVDNNYILGGGGGASHYDAQYSQNTLDFGGTIAGYDCDEKILTPEETWHIDKKIDDGRPGYGNVLGRYWDDECAVANAAPFARTNLDADYKLADASEQCSLISNNVF